MLRFFLVGAAVLAAVALAVSLGPARAFAYPAPTGLGNDSADCPPRPADWTSGDAFSQDEVETAQQLADACQLAVQQQAQTHSDLAGVDADVQSTQTAIVAAIGGLDQDVRQLDADVKAGNQPGTSNVAVSNWPTDQTVGFDAAGATKIDGDSQALHNDLWIILGAIVGCWLFGIVLSKVWP